MSLIFQGPEPVRQPAKSPRLTSLTAVIPPNDWLLPSVASGAASSPVLPVKQQIDEQCKQTKWLPHTCKCGGACSVQQTMAQSLILEQSNGGGERLGDWRTTGLEREIFSGHGKR